MAAPGTRNTAKTNSQKFIAEQKQQAMDGDYAEEPPPNIWDSANGLAKTVPKRNSEPTNSPSTTRESKKAKTTGNNSNSINTNHDSETLGARGQVNDRTPPDGSPSQTCTNEAGVDYAERMYCPPNGMDPAKWTKVLEESATYCEVENVVFCDSRRIPKESFQPSEAIFVLVKFRNPTNDDAFIYCGGNGTFLRSGVILEIQGEKRYPIPTSPSIRPLTRILPGASYTFFRQLSIGAPTTPLPARSHKIYFETPRKTGTYTVIVKHRYPFFTFSGSFKLNVISEGTMTGRPKGSGAGAPSGISSRTDPQGVDSQD